MIKLVSKLLLAGAVFFVILFMNTSYAQQKEDTQSNEKKGKTMDQTIEKKVVKTDAEWKKELTPEQYNVLREKGTERPFTGKYWNFNEDGVYVCAACGAVLFDSKTKFDAHCGWPSFSDVINNKNLITKDDYSHGMHRIEVMCAHCGSHLGHLFDDGPDPTGLRYCINSVSIKFEKREDVKK